MYNWRIQFSLYDRLENFYASILTVSFVDCYIYVSEVKVRLLYIIIYARNATAWTVLTLLHCAIMYVAYAVDGKLQIDK